MSYLLKGMLPQMLIFQRSTTGMHTGKSSRGENMREAVQETMSVFHKALIKMAKMRLSAGLEFVSGESQELQRCW